MAEKPHWSTLNYHTILNRSRERTKNELVLDKVVPPVENPSEESVSLPNIPNETSGEDSNTLEENGNEAREGVPAPETDPETRNGEEGIENHSNQPPIPPENHSHSNNSGIGKHGSHDKHGGFSLRKTVFGGLGFVLGLGFTFFATIFSGIWHAIVSSGEVMGSFLPGKGGGGGRKKPSGGGHH